MISYLTNQRRSVRWDGSRWQEEVLSASGVEVDQLAFNTISGSQVQDVLDNIDNVITGFENFTASGILVIEDVSNVLNTTAGNVGGMDCVLLGEDVDSSFKFSFGVPAQPNAPIHLRLAVVPMGNVSGNVKFNLEYNIFEAGDDVTLASFTYSGTATQSLNSSDFETLRVINLSMPTVNFSSGSAPFILSCKITRDVTVGSNYDSSIALVKLYADNVPGGIIGNQAGYIGGNLEVTGDLRVTGATMLQGGSVPANAASVGESGSLVLSDDFIYVAPATNTWKRVPISSF